MQASSVNISEAAQQKLKDLVEQTGQTMTGVLETAIDEYHRKLFFCKVNAGYAALRADPIQWAEELAERKLWDTTLLDGLDPDEPWSEDGRCENPDSDKS